MASFDVEDIIDAIDTYLKANLGTKITAINTEKGDSLLASISSDAYYRQFVDSEIPYDPFLIMGIMEPEVTQDIYGESARTFKIDVIIYFEAVDATEDYKRVYRYQKALREVIQDGYNSIFKRKKISVSGLTPVTVQIAEDAQMHRATGVSLSVTIV